MDAGVDMTHLLVAGALALTNANALNARQRGRANINFISERHRWSLEGREKKMKKLRGLAVEVLVNSKF